MLIKKLGTFCNEFGVLEDGKIYEVSEKVAKHLIKIEAAVRYEGLKKAFAVIEFEILPTSPKIEKEEKEEEVKANITEGGK